MGTVQEMERTQVLICATVRMSLENMRSERDQVQKATWFIVPRVRTGSNRHNPLSQKDQWLPRAGGMGGEGEWGVAAKGYGVSF